MLVEGLAHPELGLLLVRLAVARLALDDLVELDRRRIVVLAVVQLERALEHLRRLIAGRPLLPAETISAFFFFLANASGLASSNELANRQTDDTDTGHAGTSLVVRGEHVSGGEERGLFYDGFRKKGITFAAANPYTHLQNSTRACARVELRTQNPLMLLKRQFCVKEIPSRNQAISPTMARQFSCTNQRPLARLTGVSFVAFAARVSVVSDA